MYKTTKLLIKYKRKSEEELIKYCDTYLKNGKINQKQYDELMGMIAEM